MKYDRKKLIKIIGELQMFFMKIGSKDTTINVLEYKDSYTITCIGSFVEKEREYLKNIDRFFSQGASDDYEEGYWELSGSLDYDEGSELLLVGSMTYDANVEIIGNSLKFIIHRKKGD